MNAKFDLIDFSSCVIFSNIFFPVSDLGRIAATIYNECMRLSLRCKLAANVLSVKETP